MKFILDVLISRWFLGLVGTTLLAVLVWFFGPFLPPLESWIIRLAIVAVMLILWAGINLLLDLRKRRRDAALTDGLTAQPADTSTVAMAEETAALRERLSQALGMLKKARGTKGYLYEQPWYAIIGPPGAGKTTALLNAGLRFPLAADMGQDAVPGIGGTRLCDWWFTDEAVLIDTSGRYTTQDSDAQVDRAGWEAFLDLLKRTRTRQPLNGVMVAIALSDIARAPEAERLAHARAIRQRVKELETRLGVRMPVYLLFTKVDLIAGFTEFFSEFDREKREQVWGATFSLATDALKNSPSNAAGAEIDIPAVFATEFHALLVRLDEQLLDRLQQERGADRRALIAGFPAQVASLEQPLLAFVQEAFASSKLDRAPLLRGAYFTSGTQEGTPIDRLTGSLARAFGLDQRRLPSLQPVQGRSYFLTRLLREVIFGEALLVAQPPAALRRRMLIKAGAFAAVLLAVGLTGAALWSARHSGAREIDATARALEEYEQTARGLTLDPVGDADLPRLVPLLDQARGLPHGVGNADQAEGLWSFGLSQDAKLAAAARTVYRHALERALLPRLIWRLEAQMRGRLNQPDFLYEATRVYLMLGSSGPLDRGLVHDWMMLDWQSAYPGATYAPMRETLLLHLDALLAEPLPAVQLDGDLVAKARSTFSRVPLAQRIYSRIRPSAAAQAMPAWRPRDALGPAGISVFTRLSGKSMDDGIPGFLTVDGFHRVLLPSLGNAAKNVASESWVLGARSELDPNGPQMRALERDVIALYEADYIQNWDAMLNDLNVVPLRSLSQAAQDLYILASPQSPMRDLLAAVARQVTLSVPPAGMAAPGSDKPTAGAAQPAANERLGALFSTPQPGQAAPLPAGHEIDEHYKPLRDLVGSGPGAPVDLVLKSLNDLQQQLAKMAAAPVGGAPAPPAGDDPALALRAEAQRQPQPLARWLGSMASSGTALRGGNAKQQMVVAFNGTGGPASLCALAVNGRYPFTPGSASDVPLDDFARLFAPGGLIDGFFNTQLRPYVVTSGKVWQLQPADGVVPPITPTDLAQFQRAATIRDLFFAGGSATPTVRFDITPLSLDAGARQATLDLDGTAIVSIHGPPRATQITCPGPNRMQTVRLVFDPPPSGGSGALQDTGPWAMFRMFGHARMQQADSPERFKLTFQVGEREAVFEIRAGSILNPFAAGALQDFRCPAVQ